MSFKKKIMAVAAVGALSVMAAVPAMAFENEFHGTYKMKYFLSNVDNYTGGSIDPTAYTETTKTNNYFEQRARLMYIAKASDDLKLVTHFELDSRFGGLGGTGGYKGTVKGGDTGQLDADSLILEVKNVYLDFNLGKNINVKTGVQPFKDSLKGILLDADVAGVSTTTKLGNNLVVGLGYYRLIDSIAATGNSTTGQANLDFGAFDVKYNLTKDTSFGAVYYLVADYRNAAATYALNGTTLAITTNNSLPDRGTEVVHTFGLYGNGKIGPVALSGFGAMQIGNNSGPSVAPAAVGPKDIYKIAYAANLAAKVALGPGTLKAAGLFTTGDDGRDNIDTAWYTVRNGSSSVSSYNEGNMMLLIRNTAAAGGTTDRELIYQTGGDNTAGMAVATLGYDAAITPKLSASANAGMAWVTKNQVGTGSNLMGTEFNIETNYKVYDNLTAGIQAAYVVLGGLYTNRAADSTVAQLRDPANPYTARVVLSYAF